MRTLIIIPARLNSTRFPRKLLLRETGKPLIAHVVEQVRLALDRHYESAVAIDASEADREEFYRLCLDCPIIRTGQHPNGTSRAAEALSIIEKGSNIDWEAVCVVQADCPEIPPSLIDEVIEGLEKHPEWDCATAASEDAIGEDSLADVNRVKVAVGFDSCAVNFARAFGQFFPPAATLGIHIGIYAYRRAALLRYAAAGPCEREVSESLEQLRAMECGLRMGVILTNHVSAGIDTPADYSAFVQRWKAAHSEAVAAT